MKQPTYRIVPLSPKVADAARRGLASGTADHALITADSPSAYPCRHCLQWANPGEQMILFPFTAVGDGPYQERGPIFVHAAPCHRYAATEDYPAEFRSGRVVRAYDARKCMIDAGVVNGEAPEQVIEELLANPHAAFLHVRSATRGCYTLGVERV
ncbi:MAG TPA: DUF1203 domain-containing protein [Chthoniobacterales bacterium]|nr:DUF1203 domain-containing protein [Chthoniobacterales bacterium]